MLVTRLHRTAVADLSTEEAAELGPLVQRVSVALREVVGCEKTYVAQFAEHPQHRHVHVHVIPRAADLPEEHQGPRAFSLIGVPDEECVTEARMDELAEQLAQRLA